MKFKKLNYDIPDILDYLNLTRNFVSLDNQEELISTIIAHSNVNEQQAREITRLFFEEWITSILHGYHMELKCGIWERPEKKNGSLSNKITFKQSNKLRKKLENI